MSRKSNSGNKYGSGKFRSDISCKPPVIEVEEESFGEQLINFINNLWQKS